MHIITDPAERMQRCLSLMPGESVRVAKDPPFLWAYPRHIVVHEFPDCFVVRRLSLREVAITRHLDSLPCVWSNELE